MDNIFLIILFFINILKIKLKINVYWLDDLTSRDGAADQSHIKHSHMTE